MTKKLYVGNLPFSVDDQALADAFGEFGELQEAKVVQDRFTGRSRGFGFVTFISEDGAKQALSMDGRDLDGRSISVSYAQENPRSDRGGERRSGGFNRFGGDRDGGGGRGGFRGGRNDRGDRR